MAPKHLTLAALPAAMLLAGSAFAAPFQSLDTRSMAMGGVGVASANYTQSAFFNPSLLAATQDSDDLAASLVFGGGLGSTMDSDQADTLLNDLDAHVNLLDQRIITFNNVLTDYLGGTKTIDDLNGAASDLSLSVGLVRQDFESGDGQGINTLGGGGGIIAIPSKNLAMALVINAGIRFDSTFDFSDGDNLFIQGIETTVADPASATQIDTSAHNWTSGFAVDAFSTMEIGLSLAHEFKSLGGLAIGVTPKAVTTKVSRVTFNADENVDVDFNSPSVSSDHSYFNMDVGVTKKLGMITLAASARDLIEQELDHLGTTVTLEPRYTLGTDLDLGFLKLGADYDLAESNGHQYFNVGAEFDLYLMQLRTGYSSDIGESNNGVNPDVFSLGIGFNVFELAIQTDADKNIAGAMRFGFNW